MYYITEQPCQNKGIAWHALFLQPFVLQPLAMKRGCWLNILSPRQPNKDGNKPPS